MRAVCDPHLMLRFQAGLSHMAPLPPLSSRPSVARAGIQVPLRWLFRMPGYLGPGSAAHHPRVALRAPEGKLVPGPRYGADPGMLRCARDDSRVNAAAEQSSAAFT